MKISIVSTLYNSEATLEEFSRRVIEITQQITEDIELILVNDGSPDESLQKAIQLHENDKRVKVVDLSRNFGHHKAMMTGLSFAGGDLVFLLDCDLEESPDLLLEFHKEMISSDADVVYGVQGKRGGKIGKRFSGYIFYKLFNLLSDTPIPNNLITARLMSKRYVRSLLTHHEREMIIAGLWAITGYKQIPVEVIKSSINKTNYTILKRIAITVNAITSFTNKPLLLIFYLGLLISSISFILAINLVVRRIFFSEFLAGWPSLIVSIWLLGGLTILCIGIVGIYLSKIFIETKQRPYTIVRSVYGLNLKEDHEESV